jgi:hypothetical protein
VAGYEQGDNVCAVYCVSCDPRPQCSPINYQLNQYVLGHYCVPFIVDHDVDGVTVSIISTSPPLATPAHSALQGNERNSTVIFTHVLDQYGYCPPNEVRNIYFWDDYR